ncbi:hypothetical protein L195_g035633 [Trifolium pratense]|uniref:Uncharacterized protein n=1 Tax=Trifolium pratense TaxID=57577 RepID=A0A2K3LM95_TRIPR|nr:hypothetical protein L195_g035633 [Trifolium pratense]
MNTYDATEGVEERAGCGGLLHDEHGNWLCGIKGYSKVDLQLDSMIVVPKFWRQDTWNIQRVL